MGPAKYRGNIWLNKRATPKRPPTVFLATSGLLPPPSPPVHDVTGEQSLQARDVPIGGSCQQPLDQPPPPHRLGGNAGSAGRALQKH